MKIPKLELQFVKSQRSKKFEKEGMQMSLVDFKEDTRQKRSSDRKMKEMERNAAKMAKEKIDKTELSTRVTENESCNLEEGGYDGEKSEERIGNAEEREQETELRGGISQRRNRMDITGTAETSMRYELSVQSTEAVTTAFLGDLIRAGELHPSKADLAIDPRKLQRARDKVLSEASEQGLAQTEEDSIRNVMFDSRIDHTKVRQYDDKTGRFYSRIEDQDHYTLTIGEGRFLVHLTKPGKPKGKKDGTAENSNDDSVGETTSEGTKDSKKKPAEVVARMIYEWMKLHGVTHTLQFLSCDSTNSNTGWRASKNKQRTL